MQAKDTVRPQLRRRAARASIRDEAETGKPSSTRTGGCAMKRVLRTCALIIGLAFLIALYQGALAQKSGGVLKVTHRDSPASMSIHEEGTYSVIAPMMGVFNNLVLYDQHTPQNSLATIRPELATEWAWDEDGKSLTFKLRQGVKWHDGKPFTAADVKCTWDLLAGRAQDRLRTNFRAAWYENLAAVTANGDHEVTFCLKQRQPAFIALLASGYSPVYPCHVPAKDMRVFPIGTGPKHTPPYRRGCRKRYSGAGEGSCKRQNCEGAHH